MSVQTPTTYNPEAVSLVIDGVLIDGLAEDGITVEREAESEITEGMDSGLTFNFHPSRACTVTVQLRAASAGAKRMADIQRESYQTMRDGGAHPNITGIAEDPVNGSRVATANVFFLNEPLSNFQMQAGTHEYKLAFVNYDEDRASDVS